ncbi:unnamed protein product [Ectocarpus sp. 13 AM-2016]
MAIPHCLFWGLERSAHVGPIISTCVCTKATDHWLAMPSPRFLQASLMGRRALLLSLSTAAIGAKTMTFSAYRHW